MRVQGARLLVQRRPRRLSRAAAAETRAVTIVSPGGLGDRLVAVALGYHLAAAGIRAAAVTETGAPADDGLPALPLLAAPADDSPELRLRELEAFRWGRPGDMLRELLREIGVEFGPVPAHACLQVEPWYRDAVRELVGERRYVLIAPEGHYEADAKRMSRAQVEAVAAVARRAGRTPVVVHDEGLGAGVEGVLDLSGRTSLSELCALVAHADAVVSTDTGVLHLAGAYHTPLVALCPRTLHPTRFWHSYLPAVWLACRDAADVAPRLVGSATRRMLEAVDAQWAVVVPDRRTCGVADTGRRIAAAAGVPCTTIGQWGSRAAVGEYHPYDFDQWAKARVKPAALVVHTIHQGRLPYRPAVAIARSRAIARRVLEADAAERAVLVPLPTLRMVEEVKLPARPRTVAWHGIVHRGKGLATLLVAFRQARRQVPDARLVLISSRGDTAGTRRDFEELAAVREPGVEVRCRKYWTVEELVQELERADIYCYPDSDNGEQSAASSDVLGFGRPVVVSESTKHDDVRPWCVTARPEALAETLVALMTDLRLYAEAAVRAWQGASFRRPQLVARQYRAAVLQGLLDAQ